MKKLLSIIIRNNLIKDSILTDRDGNKIDLEDISKLESIKVIPRRRYKLIGIMYFFISREDREAIRGDIIELRDEMVKDEKSRINIYMAILDHVFDAIWSAIYFKVQDWIRPSKKREVEE